MILSDVLTVLSLPCASSCPYKNTLFLQTTRGRLRDALECVVALARTLPEMPNFVRFACPGPLVDRLYVGELKRDVS